MTPHRLAKQQHKHTRKSFCGTISEWSIAVLLKRAHANAIATPTNAPLVCSGSVPGVLTLAAKTNAWMPRLGHADLLKVLP
jgi:hypothetical protein